MMFGYHILPPPPEPAPLQITSVTFDAKGVCLAPQQLKNFKAIATELDKQRTKVIADEDWHGILEDAQQLFWASFIWFG